MAASGTGLLRSAVLFVGDRQDAEDLVQVTLERTYRSWFRVCNADKPEAYVRRILLNAVSNHWRKKKRRPHAQVPLTAVNERHLSAQDDQHHLVGVRDALLRSLDEVTPQQREVLVLRYFWDLSEAEAARLLGCSVGTIKSRASRGIAQLRTSLDEGKTSERSLT